MSSHKGGRSSLASSSNEDNYEEEEFEKPYKKTKCPKALKHICSDRDLDNILVYFLTRKLDDTSDDSQEKNWKRVDYRVLKNIPNHGDVDDEDDDEGVEQQNELKVVERSIACCISEFNSGLAEDSGGDEQVRVGFYVVNYSSMDIACAINFNGSENASVVVTKYSSTLIRDHRNANKGFAQDFIISKSKMANDESETVDRALLDKLGIINVKIFKAVKGINVKDTGSSKKIKSTDTQQFKIKESMIKTGAAIVMNFGAAKQIPTEKPGGVVRKYSRKEVLIHLEIKYRNYIGYLVELAKANVPIEQKKTTTTKEKSEIIEIESSDEEDEATESTPSQQQTTITSNTTGPQTLKNKPSIVSTITPFKSQSLMSKVKENVAQLEAMSTADLIKFIKLIDENLYEAVKDPFRNERIDGGVFLALSGLDLKELGIKIGEQIKLKQIIQQVREN